MTDSLWSDMVGAYVLDALEGEELQAFEVRLAEDAELRRLVDEARASTLVLAEALPDMAPPAHLKDRVLDRMQEAKASGALGGGAAGDHGRAAPDISPDGRADREADPRGDRTLETGGHQGPGNGPDRDGSGGSGGVRSAAPWLLLAASAAGLFWLGSENRELTQQTATLEEELDAVRSSLGNAQVALARFDSMAAALSGPNVQLATLTGDNDPTLRLVWNRDRNLLLVAAQNLPPLPQGRTFQLWGIRGTDAPVSLGTFDTSPTGDALVTLPADLADDYDVSAITEEPAGGSPQPTTTPFLVGAWNAAQ